MNGLSAALKDASLFNDKFQNVWIFFFILLTLVQPCKLAVVEAAAAKATAAPLHHIAQPQALRSGGEEEKAEEEESAGVQPRRTY